MTEAKDIVESIRASGKRTRNSDDKTSEFLSADSRKINLSSNSLATKKNMVYSGLDLFPKSLEVIMNENRLDIGTVTEILLSLQLEGLVQEISKNCYVRINI